MRHLIIISIQILIIFILADERLAAASLDIHAADINQFVIKNSEPHGLLTELVPIKSTQARSQIGNIYFDDTIVKALSSSTTNPLLPTVIAESRNTIVPIESKTLSDKCNGLIRDAINNLTVSICFPDNGTLPGDAEAQLRAFMEEAEMVYVDLAASNFKTWNPVKTKLDQFGIDVVNVVSRPSDCMACPNYMVLTSHPFK